jgi:hypothetical protein
MNARDAKKFAQESFAEFLVGILLGLFFTYLAPALKKIYSENDVVNYVLAIALFILFLKVALKSMFNIIVLMKAKISR